MIIDLHTHTLPWSEDSNLKIPELIHQAKQAGLDGICLTEHVYFWNKDDLVKLSQEHDFLLLPGAEIDTYEGHILVFGVNKYSPDMHRSKYLRHVVDEAGGVMILAHPYRRNFHNDDDIHDTVEPSLMNPCDLPVLKKTYRVAQNKQWVILEKDIVDEIIFKMENTRNRLLLELMARGGMRVGEVLKLRVRDIDGRRLNLVSPKSGRQSEIAFIPRKVADRLKRYIQSKNLNPNQRVFPFCYTRAREIVRQAGNRVGIQLKPHDLRRHAATYASRSGVPLEIISKIILRHANLATTQRYLGKISDTEAIRWIETIYN